MKPEDRNLAFVWDMRDFAQESHALVEKITFAELEKDSMRKRALERGLELLGEAARRVSPAFQAGNPQIEWKTLIGQRNVLAHEYGLINHRRLYDSARRRIPSLLAELERLLKDAQ
jgi:uncharacterized protein with HEPN domain